MVEIVDPQIPQKIHVGVQLLTDSHKVRLGGRFGTAHLGTSAVGNGADWTV